MKSFTSGFLHWSLQRNSAISLVCFVLGVFLFNLTFFNSLILIVIGFHFKLGFETLTEDYVHNKTFKLIGVTLLRLVLIYLIKSIFLFVVL